MCIEVTCWLHSLQMYEMRKTNLIFTLYLFGTGIFSVLLWYPSMIYLDLSGMGGYDGFASVSMMEQHGVWSSTDSHTFVYYILNGAFLIWCVSLINLPFVFVLGLKKYWKKLNRS